MPRFFRSARICSTIRSVSPATSAFGTSSSAALTSASITLALLRAWTRNLTSRSRFLRTSARSASTVPPAMPSALASDSSIGGRCWASIFFSVTMKSASLPATSLPW